MRKCPVCKKNIDLWTFFKPGLLKSAGPIKCASCNSIISPPWRKYNWIGFLGFGLAGFSLRLFPKESLGIQNEFLYYIVLISALSVFVLGTIYITMPLDEKYNETDAQQDS